MIQMSDSDLDWLVNAISRCVMTGDDQGSQTVRRIADEVRKLVTMSVELLDRLTDA